MLTIENVKPLIEKRWTLTQIGDYLDRCPATVCVFLKKVGLKTNPNRLTARLQPVCAKCGCDDPTNFLRRTGLDKRGHPRRGWCSWCKTCTYENVRQHKERIRAKVRSILGDKCVVCGFDRYVSALDVHHTDPSRKDPRADQMGGWSLKRIERELASCVLLCSNCHRGFHNDELSVEDRVRVGVGIGPTPTP